MKNNKNLIDKLFLIILSVQTGLMGIAFATQILRIYYSKPSGQFSREIVGEYLMQILPVMIIWLVMVIANAIYFTINHRKEKNTVKITYTAKLNTLMGLAKDFDNENSKEDYESFKREERKRLISKIINLAVLAICSLMGLLYLINPEHFKFAGGESPTTKVISMAYYLLPWVIIALISMLANIYYNEASAKRSIEILKAILKKDGKKKREFKVDRRMAIIKNVATYSILIASVVLIIVGVMDGTAKQVLLKACAICTECIGLG